MATKKYYEWRVRVDNQLSLLKDMINEEPEYKERLGIVHDITISLVSTFANTLPDCMGLFETAKLTSFDLTKKQNKDECRKQYMLDKDKIDEAREDQK